MKKKTGLLLGLFLAALCAMIILSTKITHASAGTVTGYEQVVWGISTGRYYVNGIHAFCSEYNKSWPTVGTQIVSITPCSNDVIRRALYYGYHGPGNTLGTDARAHVLTAIAISDANIGVTATDVKQKYHEFYWDIVNNPSKYPTPTNQFKAYLAKPSSNQMQTLAFYVLEKNGYVDAEKTSGDVNITDGNPLYTLEGAEYEIFKDATCNPSSEVGTLVTDNVGKTNRLELPPGTYYAKERIAPKGYKISSEIYSFTVTSEKTTSLKFQDDPISYTPDILLQKVDAQTGEAIPQRNASLQGAQFSVKFYGGLWEEGMNPESLGEQPIRTWIFETDKEGKILWSSAYQIEGDSLFEKLPLGTLTIQEIKASDGYERNDDIFIQLITESGMEQPPTVKEQYIELIPLRIKLPETGSSKTLCMLIMGGFVGISYIYLLNQKRRKEK